MRERIAFVTSAFLSDPDLDSSFDFFAILTSEVVQNLQDKYDVVVRVPKPDINGETGLQQKALLSDILNGSPPYPVYVVSPIDANAVAEVVFPFLKKYPAARFITVDQSLEGCSPQFKIKGVTVPHAVVPHNYHGGQLAARSLWKYYESIPRNHLPRKPKFIVVKGTGESQVREQGFRDEIISLSRERDNVITIFPDRPLPYTRESARQLVSQKLDNDFDLFKNTVGIFACNDELALGVCDALQWDHLANPRREKLIKAAVVGFDGIRDVTGRINKRDELWLLNTVKIPIGEMAKELNNIVQNLFSNGDASKPLTEVKCDLFLKDFKQQIDYATFVQRRDNWIKAFAEKLCPHIVAITIKPEEQYAITKTKWFKTKHHYDYAHRRYMVSSIEREDGTTLDIAFVRPVEQGVGAAQDAARDAIEDLNPKLIALVGIGGAHPAEEYTLGDVIVCTRLHDLTMSAYIEDPRTLISKEKFTNTGGPMKKEVQLIIEGISTDQNILDRWNNIRSIRHCPKVPLDSNRFYGQREFKKEIKRIFNKLHPDGKKRKPIFYPGPIISASRLVKDPSTIERWTDVARDFVAIDMELPGVYTAANRRGRGNDYPIIAIRGVSDVVGYLRSSEWTNFACKTAAAFFIKLIRVHPLLAPDSQLFL